MRSLFDELAILSQPGSPLSGSCGTSCSEGKASDGAVFRLWERWFFLRVQVNTGLHDDRGMGKNYAAALRIGEQVKAEINKNYKKLEIDVEAVFRRLLLLKKKKYACCIVLDYAKRLYKLEQKGLDIVRRDWAKLTKVVGNELLQIMFRIDRTPAAPRVPDQGKTGKQADGDGMSSSTAVSSGEDSTRGEGGAGGSGKTEDEDAVDAVVGEVHEKLREVAKQMRGGRVPLEFFVITKALTKLPQMYARGAGGAVMHPHVQVALRMQARGMSVKPGNEIPFVICTDGSTRAYLQDGVGAGADKVAGHVAGEGQDASAASSSDTPAVPASSSSPDSGTTAPEGNDNTGKGNGARGRGPAGGGGLLSVAERAFHPREVASRRNVLQIDVDYYLEQQLLPPIQRLCAYVEGTSAARLAECLGLDVSKHARLEATGGDEEPDGRDARERAGEERIMALISKSEEKYKAVRQHAYTATPRRSVLSFSFHMTESEKAAQNMDTSSLTGPSIATRRMRTTRRASDSAVLVYDADQISRGCPFVFFLPVAKLWEDNLLPTAFFDKHVPGSEN